MAWNRSDLHRDGHVHRTVESTSLHQPAMSDQAVQPQHVRRGPNGPEHFGFPHHYSLSQVVVVAVFLPALLQVGMQNAWLLYRTTEAAKHQPLTNLELQQEICNVYYKWYVLVRPPVGRSVGASQKQGCRQGAREKGLSPAKCQKGSPSESCMIMIAALWY